MLTETQKRVARAMSMLDSGMEAREVARECGYKNVNGMMGAIALHGRRNPNEEEKAIPEKPEEAVPAERREPARPFEEITDGRRIKANPSIVVETGGIRLQYNQETDSVMLTVPGNPRFFWIGKRDQAASKLMRALRDAASAMAVLLGDRKNE